MEYDIQKAKRFQFFPLISWYKRYLGRLSWWVLGLFWLAFIIVEFFELLLSFNGPFSGESKTFFLFVLLIIYTSITLGILLLAYTAKTRAFDLLELQYHLSNQLALASDWDNLVEVIISFCKHIIKLDYAVLLVRTPQFDRYETAVQWNSKLEPTQNNSPAITAISHYISSNDGLGVLYPMIKPSKSDNEAAGEDPLEGYCLPLLINGTVTAKLIFNPLKGHSLNSEQANILNTVSPVLAIALDAAQKRRRQADLVIDQAKNEERRHLARDLHDMLGQKLAYLRLKLDQLASEPETFQLVDIRAELEQMLLAANESVDLVRGTLTVLGIRNPVSLLNLLRGHSKMIRDHTGLEITLNEIGQPQTLPSDLIQEIVYIFGEALSNVVRHACAKKVAVKLVWSNGDLVISVTDDGQGFNTAADPHYGHYGLAIMRERTENIGGHFDLHSTKGHGTRLTICFPVY